MRAALPSCSSLVLTVSAESSALQGSKVTGLELEWKPSKPGTLSFLSVASGGPAGGAGPAAALRPYLSRGISWEAGLVYMASPQPLWPQVGPRG